MREIEIKLKVNDIDSLETKLKEAGCVFEDSITQQDVIYSSSVNAGSFDEAKEGHVAIRIRKEGEKAKLTLKQQKTGEMDNLEYESEIEDIVAIDKILSTLGWKPEVAVVKTRKQGKLGEYQVCLDGVEQLGNYIELEKIADEDSDPEKIRDELLKTLEPFGLTRSDEETKGYDTLIYLKNKK